MDTKFKPGDIVFLPYKGRGVLQAKVSYLVVYTDGDVEYYLEGWSGAYQTDDLHDNFLAAKALLPKTK